jgi:hypothetical protein
MCNEAIQCIEFYFTLAHAKKSRDICKYILYQTCNNDYFKSLFDYEINREPCFVKKKSLQKNYLSYFLHLTFMFYLFEYIHSLLTFP